MSLETLKQTHETVTTIKFRNSDYFETVVNQNSHAK